MTLRSITPGSTIVRAYYAVPGDYTIGQTFTEWDDAVIAARTRHAELVASLTESLAGYATSEEVRETADTQVAVDLRWVIRTPDGTELDTVIERIKNVPNLRTRSELDPESAQPA
ncbi:hypothetical protein JNW90_24205 [Micromonospora sp. STR1s_5]|nr:hypothetical protein [Micromonospora sp. STR1s_5]